MRGCVPYSKTTPVNIGKMLHNIMIFHLVDVFRHRIFALSPIGQLHEQGHHGDGGVDYFLLLDWQVSGVQLIGLRSSSCLLFLSS